MSNKITYDFEFLEGKQDKLFLGIKYGETQPTIEPISLGMVDLEDDTREYYAVFKDFNLKEAWNRYDIKVVNEWQINERHEKVFWIRENVLKPIWREFFIDCELSFHVYGRKSALIFEEDVNKGSYDEFFTFDSLRSLLNKYGKTREQIAQEVFEFCTGDTITIEKSKFYDVRHPEIELYGYYSSYDHVCFSWLFGKMIDLPNGFPMYTRDLKQTFDEKCEEKALWCAAYHNGGYKDLKDYLIKEKDYPKQVDSHHSLSDARWNRELYKFLQKINYRQ